MEHVFRPEPGKMPGFGRYLFPYLATHQ